MSASTNTHSILPSAAVGFAGRALGLMAPLLGLLVVIVIFYAIPPHASVTLMDLRTVLVHTVIVGIGALGMTFIIISGGIDLSVGSSIALASVTTALTLKQGYPLAAGVVIALATGAACGFYNGLLITLLRLPPFIATLGTLGFYRGVAKGLAESKPVNAPTFGLETWVQPIPPAEWLVFAPGVWLLLGLAIAAGLVLHFTIAGRYALAIGSNEATARLCGIRVPRVKVLIYAGAGLLTGLAGLLQFGRLTQGDPTVAVGLELDIIAAVVIGGGSLAGGQASVAGTLVGAFMMAYLKNRCTVAGLSNFVQEMIVGHIIVIAVALDQWRLRRQRT
ncbi:MAG: ABC transporter permease [Phycisphaerae bacterium]